MITPTTFIVEREFANTIYSIFEYNGFDAMVIWKNKDRASSYPEMEIVKADDYFDDLFRTHRNMSFISENEDEDEDEDEDREHETYVQVCFGDDLNSILVNSIVEISRKSDRVDKDVFCKNFNRYLSRLINHQTETGGFSAVDYKSEVSYQEKTLANVASLIEFNLNKDENEIINLILLAISESINALDIEIKIGKSGTYIDMVDAIERLITKDIDEDSATVACINKDGDYKKDFGNNEVSKYAPRKMIILRYIDKIIRIINKSEIQKQLELYRSAYTLKEIATLLLFKNQKGSSSIGGMSKEGFALLVKMIETKIKDNCQPDNQQPF